MNNTGKPIVWHLSSNRWNSAITEYVLSCIRSLNQQGFNNIFSPLANSPAFLRGETYGLKTIPLPGFSLCYFRRFIREFLLIKPQVIFVYGGPEAFWCLILKVFFPRVKIIRFHGQKIRKTPLLSWLRRVSLSRFTDLILSPCQKITEQLQGLFSTEKIETIYLGCDEKVFFCPSHPIRSTERPEFIILGRLDPVKGQREFFKIMRIVLEKWPIDQQKPILHIIGEPANLSVEDLRLSAKKHQLDNKIIITSKRVEDLSSCLSRATLGIIPSLDSEIICRVAEEFLLCGTPLVVSGVGSLEETLFPEAGYSYKSLSDEDAAELIVNAALKSMKETEENKHSRSREAIKRYSLEKMGQLLAIFLGNIS